MCYYINLHDGAKKHPRIYATDYCQEVGNKYVLLTSKYLGDSFVAFMCDLCFNVSPLKAFSISRVCWNKDFLYKEISEREYKAYLAEIKLKKIL